MRIVWIFSYCLFSRRVVVRNDFELRKEKNEKRWTEWKTGFPRKNISLWKERRIMQDAETALQYELFYIDETVHDEDLQKRDFIPAQAICDRSSFTFLHSNQYSGYLNYLHLILYIQALYFLLLNPDNYLKSQVY